jgi:glycosyltransferase involved in cell wall biosynthesis
MKTLCVLLPAYNEARSVGAMIEKILRLDIPGLSIVALVVDDGSRDRTAALAREAGAQVLSHGANRGVGAAFRTGLEWALKNHFDFLVHIDADGQHRPEDIVKLVDPVAQGRADLAIGSRFLGAPPENLARWKIVSLRSLSRGVGRLTGYRLSDISCGLRCMNQRIMEKVVPTFDYDYIQESLFQAMAARARIMEIPVTVSYPAGPHSERGPLETLRYILNFLGLTAYAILEFYWKKTRGVPPRDDGNNPFSPDRRP